MKLTLSRALITLLTVGLAPFSAAGTVVAPDAFDGVEGPAVISGPLQSGGITFQWVLPASDFSGIGAGTLVNSIGFRLDGGGATNASDLTFTEWNLTLSTPSAAFPTLSETFADNLGADAQLVRSGALSIAAGSLIGGPGPNPFFQIGFDTSWAYGGGDLLVSLTHTGGGVSVGNDGVDVGSGLGNSVLVNTFNATTGDEGFFNFPVTEFGFEMVAAPEPSSLAMFGTLALLMGVVSRTRRRR